MLKSIYVVTLLVMSVTRSEQAYEQELGYLTVDEGTVPAPLAELWNAPQAEGRPYVLMKPDSDAEVYLRFVEVADQANYEPMKTLGWNAVELQVQDVDRLAGEINPARFEMIGPPKYLTEKNNIRASQFLGPDRELLYLTQIKDPAATSFRIGQATSRVDRVFIMVLGTSDLDATTRFYQDVLGQPITGPFPYQVTVLSRAWGKPADTVYDLSIAQLEEPFLIEIDQYPAEAARREPTAAGLPFGPSVVGFRMDNVAAVATRRGRATQTLQMQPYAGRRVLGLQGPAGELIELVEAKSMP